jgi:predicted phage tail protein
MASIRRVVAELRQNKAARTVAAAGVLVGLAAFAIAGWRGVLFAMGAAVFLLGVSDRIRKRVKRWYLLNSV